MPLPYFNGFDIRVTFKPNRPFQFNRRPSRLQFSFSGLRTNWENELAKLNVINSKMKLHAQIESKWLEMGEAPNYIFFFCLFVCSFCSFYDNFCTNQHSVEHVSVYADTCKSQSFCYILISVCLSVWVNCSFSTYILLIYTFMWQLNLHSSDAKYKIFVQIPRKHSAGTWKMRLHCL